MAARISFASSFCWLAVAACSTSRVDGSDAGRLDAAAPVDAGADLTVSGCAGDLVVLGSRRSWLDAPRDPMPLGCEGSETLYLASGDAGVPVTGATTTAGSITIDPSSGGATLRVPCGVRGGVDIRLDSADGCAVQHVAVSDSPAPYFFSTYHEEHSCSRGQACLGCDHGSHAMFLSGGHAHVCTSIAVGPGDEVRTFEVADETYDPCSYLPSCTPLRFDLAQVDTPVGGGVDRVDTVTGPTSIDVAVGASTTACFTAPIATFPDFIVVLDDGWTYDAPGFVTVALAHTDFTSVPDCIVVTGVSPGDGTVTAHLAGASFAAPLHVH